MYNRYSLILVSLNKDMSDAGGNIYPEDGPVKCREFTANTKITSGLYGTDGGRFTENPYCNVLPGDPWVVVRIEINDDLIVVSKEYNLVKFREGTVVFFGDLDKCAEHIQLNSRNGDDEADIRSASIAGSKILTDSHAFHHGFNGKAHTSGAGKHAFASGTNGHAIVDNLESHAIAAGHRSRAVAVEDGCCAIALQSQSRARSCGENGVSIAMGLDSTSISSGENSISAALAPNCKGSAGEGGVLVLGWLKDGKLRVKVGYVGEDVEANELYYVENDEFIKCG